MKTTPVFFLLCLSFSRNVCLSHSLSHSHQILIENFANIWTLWALLFTVLQGRELVRKWYHIEAGAGRPVGTTLRSAIDQSEVLWGVWCLHEAARLREAPLHLLFPELGGHGQSLLDQTVHWGTEPAHVLKAVGLSAGPGVLHMLGGFLSSNSAS